jgi:formyl-CoA transferase
MYGVIGALMMLLQRTRELPGQGENRRGSLRPVVDVALYESVFSVLDAILPEFDAYGVVRERAGGKIPGVVPSDTYTCADGKGLIIGGNSGRVFARLMETIGRPDLAADPDLQSGQGRAARAEDLEAAISNWAAKHSLAEAYERMSAAGVPAAPVMTIADIASDPQYHARGMLVTQEIVLDGSPRQVQFPGVVPRIEGTPTPRTAGPALGEHTREVLSDLLGIGDAEIDRLGTQGVV